jgi:hypothetical protein
MKTIKIQNTVNSADMHELQIYHTFITGSNLLSSSVSQSGIFTGEDLFKGLEFQVEDEVTQFFIKNLTLCTNVGSGSLTENSNVVEYYYIDPVSDGSVQITGESTSTRAIGTTVRQNFSLVPTLTLEALPTYPYDFAAWYSNPQFTGSALSTDNPVTITSGSFGGKTSWYVQKQLGDNYY